MNELIWKNRPHCYIHTTFCDRLLYLCRYLFRFYTLKLLTFSNELFAVIRFRIFQGKNQQPAIISFVKSFIITQKGLACPMKLRKYFNRPILFGLVGIISDCLCTPFRQEYRINNSTRRIYPWGYLDRLWTVHWYDFSHLMIGFCKEILSSRMAPQN